VAIKIAYFYSLALLATTGLSGCAAPIADSIATDDKALCEYSAALSAAEVDAYAKCRNKIDFQRGRVVALNSVKIEGYVLLPAPTAATTEVAGRCKALDRPTDCPIQTDVTGTIPASSAQPKP